MFSWYKYLIVGLVFSRLGFWSGNLFLIAPFPDLCLLVPFFFFDNSSGTSDFVVYLLCFKIFIPFLMCFINYVFRSLCVSLILMNKQIQRFE